MKPHKSAMGLWPVARLGHLAPQFGQVFASVLISFLHARQGFNAMSGPTSH